MASPATECGSQALSDNVPFRFPIDTSPPLLDTSTLHKTPFIFQIFYRIYIYKEMLLRDAQLSNY